MSGDRRRDRPACGSGRCEVTDPDTPVGDEWLESADLADWMVVAILALEDVGNWPNETRAIVVRRAWIEDASGRKVMDLPAAALAEARRRWMRAD